MTKPMPKPKTSPPTLAALKKMAKRKRYQVDLFDGLELLLVPEDKRPYMKFRYFESDQWLGIVAAFAALSALPDAKETR